MQTIPRNQLPKDIPTLNRFFGSCAQLYYRYPELFNVVMSEWGGIVEVHELAEARKLLAAFE